MRPFDKLHDHEFSRDERQSVWSSLRARVMLCTDDLMDNECMGLLYVAGFTLLVLSGLLAAKLMEWVGL